MNFSTREAVSPMMNPINIHVHNSAHRATLASKIRKLTISIVSIKIRTIK